MKRNVTAALLVAACWMMSGCDSTRLVAQWSDPALNTTRFQKVAAVAVIKGEASRRLAEESMVQEINKFGRPAQAGHTVCSDSDFRNTDEGKKKLTDAGFDGMIVMRPVDREHRIEWMPSPLPPWYMDPWMYWGGVWGPMWDPGYPVEVEIVQIETAIFSLKDKKLLWAGLTETRSPEGIEKVVREIAKDVGSEVRKRQLVAR
jgi:hypothetical protein